MKYQWPCLRWTEISIFVAVFQWKYQCLRETKANFTTIVMRRIATSLVVCMRANNMNEMLGRTIGAGEHKCCHWRIATTKRRYEKELLSFGDSRKFGDGQNDRHETQVCMKLVFLEFHNCQLARKTTNTFGTATSITRASINSLAN